MLKTVVIKNFVHFKEFTTVELKDGPNFVVGHNGSGKSSFFELIRRCLPRKINHTLSSITKTDKPGCIICKYLYPKDGITFKKCNRFLYASFLFDNEHKCYHKICQIVRLDNNIKLVDVEESYRDSYFLKAGPDHDISSSSFDSFLTVHGKREWTGMDTAYCLTELLHEDCVKTCEYIINHINKLSMKHQSSKIPDKLSTKKTSPCESVLENLDEKYFVGTFGIRGLSSIHWTRSPRIKTPKGEHKFKTSTDSAEILKTLLEDTNIDSAMEHTFFRIMTHPSEYEFLIRSKQKSHEMKISVKDGKFEVPLLKIPGGILEAKRMSLILAHKQFRTLCLDEPDKTMHPQMVGRMRNIMWKSKELQNKVILIQSHNQALISSWTLDRTLVFRLPPGGTVAISKPLSTTNFSRSDIFQIPFASYVLVTEGASDKNFIRKVLDLKCSLSDDINVFDDFKVFLCNLQVIELGGVSEHAKVTGFINSLQMESIAFYVYDRDIFFTPPSRTDRIAIANKRKEIAEKSLFEEKDFSSWNDECIHEYKVNCSAAMKFCAAIKEGDDATVIQKKLEKEKYFTWTHGDLEETVISEFLARCKKIRDMCDKQVNENTTVQPNENAESPIHENHSESLNDNATDLARISVLKKIKLPLLTGRKIKEDKNKIFNANDINCMVDLVSSGEEGERLISFLKEKWEEIKPKKKSRETKATRLR